MEHARDQPTIILQPCKQPLNLPSVTIATQGAAILRQVRAVAAMRCDRLHTGFSQFSIKLVGVVGIVANQALDRFFHKDLCQVCITSFTSCGVALSVQPSSEDHGGLQRP